MAKLIFRDDDISVYTDFILFKQVHEIFKQHKVNHRIAILAKDLWENKELFWYICSEPYLDVQLHGWTHRDYSKNQNIEMVFGSIPDSADQEIQLSMVYLSENSKRMTQGKREIVPNLKNFVN